MEPAAYSIDEFCRAHGISHGMYYKMKRQGAGPREMAVGTHKRISREAAADWRREREAEASARQSEQIS